jgi:hypothetical protein
MARRQASFWNGVDGVDPWSYEIRMTPCGGWELECRNGWLSEIHSYSWQCTRERVDEIDRRLASIVRVKS